MLPHPPTPCLIWLLAMENDRKYVYLCWHFASSFFFVSTCKIANGFCHPIIRALTLREVLVRDYKYGLHLLQTWVKSFFFRIFVQVTVKLNKLKKYDFTYIILIADVKTYVYHIYILTAEQGGKYANIF